MIIADSTAAEVSDDEREAEHQRLSYLLAGLAGTHWTTASNAIRRGLRHVRAKATRVRMAAAAEKLGIELP